MRFTNIQKMKPTQLIKSLFGGSKESPQQPEPKQYTDVQIALNTLGIDKKTLATAKLLQDKNRARRWAEQLLTVNKDELDEFLTWKRQPDASKIEELLKVPKSLVEFMTGVYTAYSEHKKEDHGAWKYVDSKSHLKIAANTITKLTPQFCDNLEPKDVVKMFATVVVRIYFALFVQLHGVKTKTTNVAKPEFEITNEEMVR